MYRIQFFGYEASYVTYSTKKEAIKVLLEFKREDKKMCRLRFKTKIKVTSTRDSYKIEFGCNLYSAAAIIKI